MNKTIKNISVSLILFVICLFNISITYADNDNEIARGDDPCYKLETTYKFYDEHVKSIKSLIEKYNIKITSEENVPTIGPDADRTSLILTMEIPKDKYGNFIKDIKEMTRTKDTLQLIDSYEPVSLGANNRTLTLIVVNLSGYERLIDAGLMFLFVITIIAALLVPKND